MVAVHLSVKTNYKALAEMEKNVTSSMNHEFIPESVNSSNGWSKKWRHIIWLVLKNIFHFFNKNQILLIQSNFSFQFFFIYISIELE